MDARLALGFAEVWQDGAQRFVVARQRQQQVDSRGSDQGKAINDVHICCRVLDDVLGTLTHLLQ